MTARSLLLSLLLGAATATAGCGRRIESDGAASDTNARPPAPSHATPAAPATPMDSGSLGFALRFFREVASRDSAANVFVSPLSAAQALAMAYEGAGGDTRREMGRLLGIADSGDADAAAEMVRALANQQDVTLAVANSLWGREGVPLRAEYLERVRRAYRAEVATLDLSSAAATARINGWVSRETRGKIPKVLDEPLPDDVVLFLLNAVYFKGRWKDEFEKSATKARPFHLASGRRPEVPMMSRTQRLRYHDGEGFRTVRLPYRGDRYAMYVFLPDSGSSLGSLYAQMRADAWTGWLRSLEQRQVHVVLPKFTVEYDVTLNDHLARLGMPSAFDPARADFSGMVLVGRVGGRSLYISQARQQVFVEVNEEGTEAAAATSISMVPTSAPPPPVEFVVDRPFLAVVRDDVTGALLFVGQVMNPAPTK